ncbi:hypothetical protein PF008_g8938 [Phytophthora fragariae]|uniref:Uncharacterized protein n=1 Tax=Phytophthora fragariae TaxID=53985 RepID=A0A6G0RZ30_9STRA|nr:hypothetical protein PF008_g8938 [Phytophthora fragariae]
MEVLTATTQDGPADLPLTLQIDNQSTIKRVKKDGTSGAQKAVDIRFHCLKEAWKTGFVALEYVPTHENPADLLTKALSRHEVGVFPRAWSLQWMANPRGLTDTSTTRPYSLCFPL